MFSFIISGQLQLARLPRLVENAHSNGVHDARLLSAAEVRHLEPNLTSSVLGGALIPGEAVVDSWWLPVSLAHQALRLGSKVYKQKEARWVGVWRGRGMMNNERCSPYLMLFTQTINGLLRLCWILIHNYLVYNRLS